MAFSGRIDQAMKLISYQDIQADINSQTLKNGSICAALSKEAIDYLLGNGEIYRAENGDVVFEFGTEGDGFFIVCQGCLDFYKVHNNVCRHNREIGFGEEIGFLSMIALRDRTGNAIAQKDTILLKVPAELFSKLHQEYPFDFGIMTLNLARDMARVLHKISNDLVEVSLKI